MFYREPTEWPRKLPEPQKESILQALERRQKIHSCTGNCGHFIEQPDQFTVNSYYQYRLARGRRDRLPKVLPTSEPDTEGWTKKNIRRVYRRKPIGKWRT